MLKIMGVILVVFGASATGFTMAFHVRRIVTSLQQLLSALELMKSEIEYHRTPMPELMRLVALSSSGGIASFFGMLADNLFRYHDRSMRDMMKQSIQATPVCTFPANIQHTLLDLGNALGKYDVAGQIRAIEYASVRLNGILKQYLREQQAQMRSYCTLGICAGLAIGIMML